jgi:hypothetical protein
MRLRAALVGCGAMSGAWLEAAGRIDDLKIVGLADLDIDRAKSRAAEFDLPSAFVAASVEELLVQTKPDLLFDVVVPSARHGVVAAGLGAGCHVLSEKPMAETLDEARDLIARAKAAGRLHAWCKIGAISRLWDGSRGLSAPVRLAKSPASMRTSSWPRTSAAFARRWTTCCCSTWRSTASTRCAV